MRLGPRWRPWTLAEVLALWLVVGLGAWALFVDPRAREARLLLAASLGASAAALALAAAIRRAVLRRRIEPPEIITGDAPTRAGEPLRFTVRLSARRAVTVSRVVAALSRVIPPHSPSELPVVLHREELVLGEGIRVAPGRPTELRGELATPADGAEEGRLQLDAVVFIGSRAAHRTTVMIPWRAVQPG